MTTATHPDRSKEFDAFVKAQQKAEPGSIFRLDGDGDQFPDIERIPSGVVSLDIALGGGFARGRIVELYGPEASGKSALAMTVASVAQKLGGYVGYVDAEHAFNPGWAESAFRMDLSRTAVTQPDDGHKGLTMVRDMAVSGAFDVIIIDSVASLVPPLAEDKLVGESQIGNHARMLSAGIRDLVAPVSQSRAVVIFINQLRNKIGGYGNPEETPGGRALKYYSSQRIMVRSGNAGRRIKDPKDSKAVIGQTVDVVIEKNKVGMPYKTCQYDLMFHSGIQGAGSLLDAGVEVGAIARPNNVAYHEASTGERIGSGRDNVKKILETDRELAERILMAVYELAGIEPRAELIEAVLPAPAPELPDEDVEPDEVTAVDETADDVADEPADALVDALA